MFFTNALRRLSIPLLIGVAEKGLLNIVALLQAGADRSKTDPKGLTALRLAQQNQHAPVVALLE